MAKLLSIIATLATTYWLVTREPPKDDIRCRIMVGAVAQCMRGKDCSQVADHELCMKIHSGYFDANAIADACSVSDSPIRKSALEMYNQCKWLDADCECEVPK